MSTSIFAGPQRGADVVVSSLRTAGTVAAPDGSPIAYESRGQGELTLLFVHGWGTQGELWSPLLQELEPSMTHQARLVTVDLPGHGRSTLRPGAQRREDPRKLYAEDLRAVMRTLGLQQVVLVGHGMGADAALRAARLLSREEHPAGTGYPQVQQVLLIAPFEGQDHGADGLLRTSSLLGAALEDLEDQLRNDLPEACRRYAEIAAANTSPETRSWLQQTICAGQGELLADLWQALTAHEGDPEGAGDPAITPSTLQLHGSADKPLPPFPMREAPKQLAEELLRALQEESTP
ncbi:MAG: alpha/beta hydrolase [Acidobacteriota bacterium]